jgi:hypothetical protein
MDLKWIEHSGSRSSGSEWNPTGGRVTALNDDSDRPEYAAVVLEKYPGEFYQWNFDKEKFDPIPGATTMEEAQQVAEVSYRMGGRHGE